LSQLRLPASCGIHYLMPICRIPDDCIDNKRYPLFIAREVMQALIDQLQP